MAEPLTRADFLRFALAGLMVLLTGSVLLMIANPRVQPAYQAYFMDRSTDCWRLPVKGTITMNQTVSFVGDAAKAPTFTLRHCGWMDPQDAGTWSKGHEASLRLNPGERQGDLVLELTMAAYVPETQPSQRVQINLAGRILTEITMTSPLEEPYRIVLPAQWIGPSGPIDLGFYFPDATPQESRNGNGPLLAIRILSVKLEEASS